MVKQILVNKLFISLLLICLLFTSGVTVANVSNQTVVKGEINLVKYNFNENLGIHLSGEWRFYWQKFLNIDQINNDYDYDFLKVPKSWKNQNYKNEILPVKGYGTYYVKVIVDKKYIGKFFKLDCRYFPTASKVFVNGKFIGSGGVIGSNINDVEPSLDAKIDEFVLDNDTLDIVIQVSNFHIQKAGIAYNIELGLNQEISQESYFSIAKDFFVIGSIFLMMLYHFVLYFQRKKDKFTLFFALTCLAFVFYTFALSDIFLDIIPKLSFEFLFKLKRLALYLSLPAMSLFLYHLYKKDVSKLIVTIIVIISFIFSIATIITGSEINAYFMTYFRYFGILTTLYLLFIIAKAIINKREGAVIFSIGLFIMFITIVNDFLHHTRVINTTDLMPIGMFIFLFSQAYLLSSKFNFAFNKNEKLTKDLTYINKNLEGIVVERTKEISEQKEHIEEKNEELNQLIEEVVSQRDEIEKQKEIVDEINYEVSESINYATRLQGAILPEEKLLKKYLSEHFVLFKPKDKVSGDFYWWSHIENHTVITAADSTGHGVPGAFMSMLGSSFLREIVQKEYVTHTGVILKKLRKEIIKALKQKGEMGEQKDGMDMAIISIDHETNIVQFSGANNPLYIIKSGKLKIETEMDNAVKEFELDETSAYKLYEIKPNKMPIAIYEKMDNFTAHEIQLEKGDQLYMFSDGYADQFGGPKGKKFKYKPFKRLLLRNADKPMTEQKELLNTAFDNWKGNTEQIDDVVVVGIKM